MRSKTKFYIVAAALISFGIIVGLVLSSSLNIQTPGYTQEYTVPQDAVNTLTKWSSAMAAVADAVKPSVVNISTSRTVKAPETNPLFEDPFFRRFFGPGFEHPRERKAMSLGSGVIVDKNGYILTNNHVIKGAEEIKVTLFDKREFKGKVIGADPKTDLAVVKIDATGLPAMKWGNSDDLKVGNLVLAIGNPYGLNQTVTSGIVSATGRANVGIADYEDFIQTDAAINPGNSGGALVNARGELVGINTAIFSTTGGYQGIGFAIPSSMAQVVMNSLIKTGKVVRGWLGIWIQPLSPELAKKFGLKEETGALVSDVVEDGPAAKAGIKGGDLIVEFDGKTISGPTQLRNLVANTAPGTEATVVFIRNGKKETTKVKIEEQKPEQTAQAPAKLNNVLNGVHVQELTPILRRQLGIPGRVQGVIIAGIDQDSPAVDTLQPQDIIMEVNRIKIRTIGDYTQAVSRIKPKDSVLLLLDRGGQIFYLTISPGQ